MQRELLGSIKEPEAISCGSINLILTGYLRDRVFMELWAEFLALKKLRDRDKVIWSYRRAPFNISKSKYYRLAIWTGDRD